MLIPVNNEQYLIYDISYTNIQKFGIGMILKNKKLLLFDQKQSKVLL